MRDLVQFFEYMNHIDFPYVVMRNFENLPYSVESGGHGDLDLLVYDPKHFEEIFPEALIVNKRPRAMYKISIGGIITYMDVRYVGDGYYPKHFQEAMLNTREYNQKGFYTPDPLHFRLGLVYHAVHHKNYNNYKRWIGDVQIPELLESLKKSKIGYSEPLDPSVGRFNQYWKGATAIVSRETGYVSKRQVGWEDHPLITNEFRILKDNKSIHFPNVKDLNDGAIWIEDCGDRINIDNLPENWREQLKKIVVDLKDNKIEHRDIKPDNLMVKDGIIKLIDFGWARFKDDELDSPPSCLGYPYRPSWGFDDWFSMRKIIKELEFQLEEKQCESLA